MNIKNLEKLFIPERQRHVPFRKVAFYLKEKNQNNQVYEHIKENEFLIRQEMKRKDDEYDFGITVNVDKNINEYKYQDYYFRSLYFIYGIILFLTILFKFLSIDALNNNFFYKENEFGTYILTGLFFIFPIFLLYLKIVCIKKIFKDLKRIKSEFDSVKENGFNLMIALLSLIALSYISFLFLDNYWIYGSVFLSCCFSCAYLLDEKYDKVIIAREKLGYNYSDSAFNNRNVFDAYFLHKNIDRKYFEPYLYELLGDLLNNPSTRFDFSFLSEQERKDLLLTLDKIEQTHAKHFKYEFNEHCPFYIQFLRFKEFNKIRKQKKEYESKISKKKKWNNVSLNELIDKKKDKLEFLLKISSQFLIENDKINQFMNELDNLKKEPDSMIKKKEFLKLSKEINLFMNDVKEILIESRHSVN